MDDETIGDLTKEDLLDFGFLKGDAIKFLKAFAAAAAPSSPAVQSHSSAAAVTTSATLEINSASAASVRSITTRAADTSASYSLTLTHSIDAAI
jgi:hypothetical protein